MGIFAAFYASELEPGQVILLPPARRGDVVQSLEVTRVERLSHDAGEALFEDVVLVHHDSGYHVAYPEDLIQVQVER